MTPRQQALEAVDWLKRHASKSTLQGMARYGLPQERAFGVSVANIQVLGKKLGRNHDLALALWDTGWFEARMLTAFVDEPARVTSAQMDRWCRDFDNWGLPDTLAFKLWDQTPFAWDKVSKWATRKPEFEKRAAFALLWALALHDRKAGDPQWRHGLALIERAADDDRNFVKKAVVMALGAVGRHKTIRAEAVALARRLADSDDAARRWVGKGSLRKLSLD